MSVHNEAKKGDIAKTVLLPGDPLRANYIAENFLEDVKCYNTVRNMLGFTGYYNGKRISVQGTGMGAPSITIYVHELINDYGAKNLIRIGTCGSLQENIKVKDVILASTSSTDSGMNKYLFKGLDYAPAASFKLLNKAYNYALKNNFKVDVGSVLTSDFFYFSEDDPYKIWREYGVLAVEMETSALYTLAAKFNVDALTILTVSDNLFTGEKASPEERQTSFTNMINIALEIAE